MWQLLFLAGRCDCVHLTDYDLKGHVSILLAFASDMNFIRYAVVCICSAVFVSQAHSQGSLDDYQRSADYGKRTGGLVFRDKVQPVWFGPEKQFLWYRVKTSREATEYVLVDPTSKTRKPMFDHRTLAAEISDAIKRKVSADRLNLKSLRVADDLKSCQFHFNGKAYRFQLPKGPLNALESTDDDGAFQGLTPQKTVVRSIDGGEPVQLRFRNDTTEPLRIVWIPRRGRPEPYGVVKPQATNEMDSFVGHAFVLQTLEGKPRACFVADAWSNIGIVTTKMPIPNPEPRRRRRTRTASGNVSPDGKFRVDLQRNNVVLRNDVTGKIVVETKDGTERDGYEGRVWWSPSSKHFVVLKTRRAGLRTVSMVESSPKNSIHSNVVTIGYAKPGDQLHHPRPVLFSIEGESKKIDDALFPNPFSLNEFSWNSSGDTFRFQYNQRGHEVLRLIGVDAETAKVSAIAEEAPDTFVCYSSKSYMRYVGDDELIWMSERSGWNHLYLIDQATGDVINPITKGDWVVRKVVRVDEEKRQLWFVASGIDAGQDPYHQHLVRVDFDGQNLTRMTQGDGDHVWQFSPDRKYLIDMYSRVDLPPVTNLRDATTGEFLCELEKADASKLYDLPWRAPERFVAKARDGMTDIYGVIVRPTNFDPAKKYPVLEAIYAGPHAAFVPKKFGTHSSLFQMAELGFIVVKIDGMGTNHRSKAFHDVCWQNLGDSGFPDRVLWIKEAAKDRPEMDLTRVGIWGGSAGGQSAMRALISHGDFYRAAVADCGCHDNRVDKIWWNEQWMGYPVGPHYAEQSNVTHAHKVKGDLMLIWGELDNNVDPASTMQVIDALIKADIDFEQLIMPGVGHGAAGRPYAKRRQADFFVRKLMNREPRWIRD